ncbi:MAG: GNAT family N-acetyltransferase [Synergistes sp.]|nr:GNAT family N-acetyltransferase [Synergistes sp.]
MGVEIRKATSADLDRIAEIESICFPAAEAASRKSIEERIKAFKETFLVALKDGKIIGFINGCVTKQPKITDDLYSSTALHDDDMPCQMVFGIDVIPEEQHKGYAIMLMNEYIKRARERNKALITLTCKEHLIGFYRQFGYKCEGVSGSGHGGARWYDMTLFLNEGSAVDKKDDA